MLGRLMGHYEVLDRIGPILYANQRIIIGGGRDLKTFGQIIAEARKALGISQKDLAGVPDSFVA